MCGVTIHVTASLTCAHCGAAEVDPATAHLPIMQQKLQIRGYKVLVTEERGWESHCLVCDKWFCELDTENLENAA